MPEQAANEQSLKQFIGRDKGLDIRTIHALRILKRSIDARQRTIYVNLKVRLYINEVPQDEEFIRTIYNKVEGKPQVIVVGAGPGGIFSAYELVTNNSEIKVAVFEKGHLLEKRKCPIDGDKVKKCISCKTCSIMSGFGGAGAFSDGKYNITNAFGGTLYE